MADIHSHQCSDCGTIWTHDRDEIGKSDEDYEKAHTCVCGQIQYYVYHTPDEIDAKLNSLFEIMDKLFKPRDRNVQGSK